MPLELLQAAAGVILGIKRSWFLVLGVPFARCILSILFLQVSTVGKQQAAQGHAAMGAVDPAAEPLFDPCGQVARMVQVGVRSEEHTSELQSLMRISYAVFRLKTKIETANTSP